MFYGCFEGADDQPFFLAKDIQPGSLGMNGVQGLKRNSRRLGDVRRQGSVFVGSQECFRGLPVGDGRSWNSRASLQPYLLRVTAGYVHRRTFNCTAWSAAT